MEEKPEQFTFPDFQRAQNARNWFESLEEVAGTLETRPGYYSVHDTMGQIKANPVTRDIFMDCLTAGLERSLSPERVMAGDESVTVADAMSVGMLAHFLAGKRRPSSANSTPPLSQVEKKP